MKKLTKIKAYVLDQIEVRKRLAKKVKRFDRITSVIDVSLKHKKLLLELLFFIARFSSGVCLPVGVVLSRTSPLFSLIPAITQKFVKTFTAKQEKHNTIKLHAQSKLHRTAGIISQTMQNRDISSIIFPKVF